MDTVLAAIHHVFDAVESAVWAHVHGREWTWNHSPSRRIDDKYEEWGDQSPSTHYQGELITPAPPVSEDDEVVVF